MSECVGFFGKVFGHKYESCCDQKQGSCKLKITPDIVCVPSYEIKDMLKQYRDFESKYIRHICVRCGNVIEREDNAG